MLYDFILQTSKIWETLFQKSFFDLHCTLTIVRYPKYGSFAGLVSMALFRLPLLLNRKITFWKLLGCGKNGTFDIHPDWRQYAVFAVGSWQFSVSGFQFPVSHSQYLVNETKNSCKLGTAKCKLLYGSFISRWWQFFKCETYTIILEPIEGHGSWDGEKIYELSKETEYDGLIAVLTRATIRLKRLKDFWQHVHSVASKTATANGLIMSLGIGELPWIKQGTFSVWQSKEHMKAFAYQMREHLEVIQKTRKEKWYSEELFLRLKPVAVFGSIRGSNPLEGKL